MTHLSGPCGLAASSECCDSWDAATPAEQQRASDTAAFLLWAWSGRRYGLCDQVVRPCGSDCSHFATYYGPVLEGMIIPQLTAQGVWINCRSGSCTCNPCNCCFKCSVPLPGPVHEIDEVLVDGIVIDPSDYFVNDHKYLVRRSGCFPQCQDLGSPSTQENTFQVSYVQGIPLDPAGQTALDVLACELLAACIGGPCKLPSRWRTLTREGITMEAFDDLALLDRGRIGIVEVDGWLGAVNPGHLWEQPFIPEMDGRTRTYTQTWP